MTKQELMETYTAEQLADKYLRLQEEFNRYAEVIKGIVSELPEELKNGAEFHLEIDRLQSEVDKYRKAFEDAKKERDCQICEYQNKINELTAENDRLKGNVGAMNYQEKQNKTNNFYGMYAHSAKNLTKDDLLMFLGILTKELTENGIDFRYEMEKELKVWDIRIETDNNITDLLPTEPIKIAETLIMASGECEPLMLENEVFKDTYRIFDVPDLRQIAEHLLVYCNHNGEAEERHGNAVRD